MAASLHSTHLNGNGHVPVSRRAFQRSLPLRLGSVEDQVDAHDQRVDELIFRVSALEARSEEKDLDARVELARQINDLFRLALGKRRPRRRPAAARP